MTADAILQLGGVGAFAFMVWQELRAWRLSTEKRQELEREDRLVREAAERDDRRRATDAIMLIHSRLGTLGADSIAPPVATTEATRPLAERRRGRLQTQTPATGVGRVPSSSVGVPQGPSRESGDE